MSLRLGILGGTVAIALATAAPAPAQESEAAPADAATAQQVAPRGVAQARIALRVKGDDGGKVDVGNRLRAIGHLRPFVPGQRVDIWLSRGKKTVAKKTVLSKQVGNKNVGEFTLTTPKLIKPGKYRIQARKTATPGQAGDSARSGTVGVRYPDLDPGDRSNAVRLFNRLLSDKAYHTSSGAKYGGPTERAVMAFRKVNNMERSFNATPKIFKTLADGKGGFKLKWPEGGKHVEADLSRQVMVLARKGKAQHIFHISSGAPATPTIKGKFPTYRKDPGTNSLGMIDSVYFIRGYATHGYHSVPPYPASHGCLRNPPPDSRFIYNWIDIGDVFYVYK